MRLRRRRLTGGSGTAARSRTYAATSRQRTRARDCPAARTTHSHREPAAQNGGRMGKEPVAAWLHRRSGTLPLGEPRGHGGTPPSAARPCGAASTTCAQPQRPAPSPDGGGEAASPAPRQPTRPRRATVREPARLRG